MTSISSVSPFSTPSLADRLTALATQGKTTTLATGGTDSNLLQIAPVQTSDLVQAALNRQMQAQTVLSKDTKLLADTVTAAFQAIIAARPDLANESFDFVSDQGAIKVVANHMSSKDRQWLESQLNANPGLVDAVNSFNTDLGSLLKANAAVDAASQPLGAQAVAAQGVKSKVDGSVHFLSLLQGVVYEAGKSGWDRDATYTDVQGLPIDLAKARTNTMAGMIDAKRQLDALENGNIVTTLKDGRVFYAAVTQDDDGKVIYPPPGTPKPYFAAALLAPAFVPGPGAFSVASGTGSLVNRMA